MKWDNFTATRIEEFKCAPGKKQTIYWDGKTRCLGLRVTSTGSKSYIFESSLNNKTIRVTIGSPKAWSLDSAQAEARRLKVVVDTGRDPRQTKIDALAEEQAARDAALAEQEAKQAQMALESITLGLVWKEYIAERSPLWSKHHIDDHTNVIQAGGEKRSRSPKLTKPGPLAQFATVPLCQLSPAMIESWVQTEIKTRPTYARLALRLLKAFLNWCSSHAVYGSLVNANAASSKKARESLGKDKVKNDVLQKEQLHAWFSAVCQIENPVISAYLQVLLITGARREELGHLKWSDVDFRWKSMTMRDKVEDMRVVPLTPYVLQLLSSLPRTNQWVFSSPRAAEGRLAEPRIAHVKALAIAGLPHLTIHGLRRSFASLCEWIEMPEGISSQIQGHKPQTVREKNYIRRPLDLLRKWHVRIEKWILREAGINFHAAPQVLKLAT